MLGGATGTYRLPQCSHNLTATTMLFLIRVNSTSYTCAGLVGDPDAAAHEHQGATRIEIHPHLHDKANK